MFMYGPDCVDFPYNHEEAGPSPAEVAEDFAKRNVIDDAADVLADSFTGFASMGTGALTDKQLLALIVALEKRGIAAVIYPGAIDLYPAGGS